MSKLVRVVTCGTHGYKFLSSSVEKRIDALNKIDQSNDLLFYEIIKTMCSNVNRVDGCEVFKIIERCNNRKFLMMLAMSKKAEIQYRIAAIVHMTDVGDLVQVSLTAEKKMVRNFALRALRRLRDVSAGKAKA